MENENRTIPEAIEQIHKLFYADKNKECLEELQKIGKIIF